MPEQAQIPNNRPASESDSSTKKQTKADWLGIGYVSKAHGVKGALVLVTDDRREKFGKYTRVLIEKKGIEAEYKITRTYTSANQPVIVVEGVESREAADLLIKARVHIPRSEIEAVSPTNADEYLVGNLIGCEVFCEEKGLLGKVIAVHNFGAQDTLEIELQDTKQTVYFPFIEAYVKDVNIENSRIDIIYLCQFFEDAAK